MHETCLKYFFTLTHYKMTIILTLVKEVIYASRVIDGGYGS